MGITIRDLAEDIAQAHDITEQAARASVEVYAEQLVDLGGREAVWTTGGDLTHDAADSIRAAVAAHQETSDAGDGQGYSALTRLEEVVAEITDLRASLDDRLDVRDGLIRGALSHGVHYAALMVITDLSRSALDAIRRGGRSRNSGS